jgi:glycosyltransferase 2 family protein
VVVPLAVCLLVAASKKLRAKIISALSSMLGVVFSLIRRPRALVAAIGTSMMITGAFVGSLWAACHSVGFAPSLLDLFLVFVAGNTAVSFSPTPGGIGAVEAAMSAVLIGAGSTPTSAVAGVLVYRIISFWLPVLPGFVAYKIADKRDYF